MCGDDRPRISHWAKVLDTDVSSIGCYFLTAQDYSKIISPHNATATCPDIDGKFLFIDSHFCLKYKASDKLMSNYGVFIWPPKQQRLPGCHVPMGFMGIPSQLAWPKKIKMLSLQVTLTVEIYLQGRT
ncbi:hypothetical protein PV326_003730 [Microctonus aethiopoides]|nr:hypothetical protein PV326_003730 [Microctonus aethiopoides]